MAGFFISLFLYAFVFAGFCVLGTLIIKAKKKKRNNVATEGVKSVKEESFEVSGCTTGFHSEDSFFGAINNRSFCILRSSRQSGNNRKEHCSSVLI